MTSEERKERRYQRRKAKRLQKKRHQNAPFDSFDRVFSYENLYRSYKKCRRNVAWKASTQRYITQAPLIVKRTYDQLQTGKFKSHGFYEFDLTERGKVRHIKSVDMQERVVQRCLCDHALVPVLSRTFVYDNGASLAGKGYHFSIGRIRRHLQWHYRHHGNAGYVLLFDFSKFFDNVDHDVIKKILRCEFTDRRIIALTEHFIDCFGDRGLGLGSQISQTFALASANYMDHFIKEVLHIRGYGRYMDDGYLIHESKEYLHFCLNEIRRICDDLGIVLNERKTQIVKLSHGFTWLKCRFYLTDTGKVVQKIYKRSVVRQRRKLKALRRLLDYGRLTTEDVYTSFQSWRAYAIHFDAWHTINNMTVLYHKLFSSTYILQGGEL